MDPERKPIPKPTSLPWPPRHVDNPDAPQEPQYWKRPASTPDRVIDAESLPQTPPAKTSSSASLAPAESLPWRERVWHAWRQVESVWLGRTSATFLERAHELGWLPDAPGDSCPRCATSLGPYERIDRLDHSRCPACINARLPWSKSIRLGSYKGLIRRAVHEIKFTRWRTLGLEVGRLLGAAIAVELQRTGVDRQRCVLVPVPTPWLRTIVRQIDHTAVLAAGVHAVTGIPVVSALSRRHRPPQTRIPASRRTSNVRDSFVPLPGRIPSQTTLAIVIDDVRTTGATLREACRILRPSPSEGRSIDIWTAVVGVTPDRRERCRLEAPPDEAMELGQAPKDSR